jgi:glycerate kinase
VGVLVAAAVESGAREVVIGLGGSATNDGGAGMLAALGAAPVDAAGYVLPYGGGPLALCEALAGVPRLRGVSLVAASDVDSPLTGLYGASAVFGPQKGASQEDIAVLDQALDRWATLTKAATGRDVACEPGAGAAGGTGFAALGYLGARLVPGAGLMLDLVGFDDALAGADLVITGEGSLDRQTLGGKAPVGVARAATARGVPVVVVAGRVELSAAELARAGFARAYSLADREPDPAVSIAEAAALLEVVGAEIAAGLGSPAASKRRDLR